MTRRTARDPEASRPSRGSRSWPLSDKARVRAVLPEIQKKRAAGWSYAQIRQELANTLGFQGTRQTLYNYVSQLSCRTPAAPPTVGPDADGPRPPPHAEGAKRGQPAQPASATPSHRRSLSQSLGGPHARETLQKPHDPESKSLVDRLNQPV